MTFKKNWLTDLIWAVTAAIIGLNIVGYLKLFLTGMPELEALKTNSSVLYDAIWLGGSAAVMGLLVLIFFLGRLTVGLLTKNNSRKEAPSVKRKVFLAIVEGIVLLCVMAGAFYVRYAQMLHTLEWKLADDFYYELAMIKINDTLPSLQHTGSYVYIYVLSFVMRILGNKVFSAVVLQFVLQMITILFLYFGMRRLAGVIPAVVSSVVFAFAYSNCALLFEADAQCLVFFLFAVAVYFTAGLFELYRKDVGSARLVFRIILAALFSGLCCFLKPYCMMLLLFGVALGLQDSEWYNGKTKACLFLSYIIATIAVGFVFFTITAVANDVDLAMVISDWFAVLKDAKAIHYALYFPEDVFRTTLEGVVLACLVFLNLPGYHVWDTAKQIPFLILLVLAPVPFCTMGTLEYDLFSLWIWGALAGIGLQLMLSPKVVAEQETPVEEPEKEPLAAEKSPVAENSSVAEIPQDVEEITSVDKTFLEEKNEAEEDIFFDEKAEAEESASLEEEPAAEEEAIFKEAADVRVSISTENDSNPEENSLLETTSKPVQYLHNPLPVPKKHVKRVADYKVNVVEDDDFDFDIHENDDFDF